MITVTEYPELIQAVERLTPEEAVMLANLLNAIQQRSGSGARPASAPPRDEHWPPTCFGSGSSKQGETDIARNVDKYLAMGFGE